MRVLGLIPARGGSKGIEKKNVKVLGDKPLIAYTIESALNSDLLTEIAVSSDSTHILEVAKSFGIETTIDRPKQFSSDESPTIDTVIHALEYYKAKGDSFDAVCLLQATYPFRSIEFINMAIEKFFQSDTDSLVSVLEVPHHYNPHWVFEKNKFGNLEISTGESKLINRRQELPVAYFRDGSIYLTRSEVILNKKSLFGNSISFIESSVETYINIDTQTDWEKAEQYLKNQHKK